MSTSETALRDRAVAGDRVALSALLKRHAHTPRRAIAGRIPRRWRSVLSEDDVLQQTFADAARDISGFLGATEHAFDKWLCRLAECNLHDALRALEAEKRGGSRRRVQLVGSSDSHHELLTVLCSAGVTPLREVAANDVRNVLEAAIAKLPEAYRVVIQMIDLDGVSAAEVAASVGRSRGAVYMLRARGHERLRGLLGDTTNYFGGSA